MYYVGLMSGTSLDAIDAALVHIDDDRCTLKKGLEFPFPNALRAELLDLCQPGSDEIERLGRADRHLGLTLATAVNQLLHDAGLAASDIAAIGSHGQTIRHRPTDGARAATDAFSLQIGDPNTIAEHTGITTVADFRRRDIAAGGQGAPLVPAFHQTVFGSTNENRVIINIGGMANISLLPANRPAHGYDTGPGNILMDAWIQHRHGEHFDRDGRWAASGRCHQALLAKLLDTPFFSVSGPKSTGRECFNLDFVREALTHFGDISDEDVQATLLEFTAQSIAQAIAKEELKESQWHLCGGGAANAALRQRLTELNTNGSVDDTDALGIHPDWVEAAAFAWLAMRCLHDLPGNLPSATGASGPRILGGIYPAR
ncbi:MAG: anhydro-N-acetylmuramic acid kinase [Spongiibacter sp.]|nr:anhydro-N-acetylmuramic acid kinase [Spongiibacter sp.]